VHLLLTDRLTCPRCGPSFGLILLTHRVEERRVHEGVLGCSNCRDSFPIVDGFADLRAPPRGERPTGMVGSPEGGADIGIEAARLSALLGIAGGPGTVALVGEPARQACVLAETAEDLHVVAIDADLAGWPDAPRVSRLVSAPGLPFFSGMLRGVVVDGRLGRPWVEEAIRVVAPLSRVIVTRAAEWALQTLEDGGLEVLASETETIVAASG
jgi:uncharacterized protein YbaR (Trm112 family)